MVIMLGHLEQTLTRNVPAMRHVFQEWNDIFRLLRTAEANDQDRIVFLHLGSRIVRRHQITVMLFLVHSFHLIGQSIENSIVSPDGRKPQGQIRQRCPCETAAVTCSGTI